MHAKRNFKELLTRESGHFWNHPDTKIIPYKSDESSYGLASLLEKLAREYTYGHASNYNTTFKQFVVDEIYKTSTSSLSVISPADLHNQEQLATALDKGRNLAGYFSYSPIKWELCAFQRRIQFRWYHGLTIENSARPELRCSRWAFCLDAVLLNQLFSRSPSAPSTHSLAPS
jgi:hypothetical protein